MRKLLSILLGFMFSIANASLQAESPLVFVSGFASGEQGAIHAFEFQGETGELKPLAQTTDVENPFFMALSPDRRFLYSIHAESFGGKENQIAAYALEGRSGKLKLLNRQSTKGKASCYIDVDNSGKTAVVSNYTTGDVTSFPLKADGSLGESVSYFQHEGSSVDPKRQKGPNAHCFVISPDDRYALAADLGIDKVMIYRLDALSGKLEPNVPAFAEAPPGAGPRHLTFHPNGKWVYVINEIGNTISRFDYDGAAGSLTIQQTISTLPDDYEERTHTADLKITPDGKFLYGTNRGHDSIACYRIGEGGELSLIEIVPSLGKGPQNLAIAPGGSHLLCANLPSDNVAVFAIDAETGKLASAGDPVEVSKPSCIMIVP